jgi:curved DNA-binding protein CbpA
MARENSTLYSVLGVSLVAPAAEIRAAYRRLARVSGGLYAAPEVR